VRETIRTAGNANKAAVGPQKSIERRKARVLGDQTKKVAKMHQTQSQKTQGGEGTLARQLKGSAFITEACLKRTDGSKAAQQEGGKKGGGSGGQPERQ